MGDQLKYLGLFSGLSGWIVILSSIRVNPWFLISEHAFSDLGGKLSSAPWIFNRGMIITGLLVISYGAYLIYISGNKISTIGGVFTMISGVFLILIGVFPTGTYPHLFVSIYFFTQMDVAIGTCGIGLVEEENISIGWFLLLLSAGGPLIGTKVDWPSTALAESYGILIMNIWMILMLRVKR